LQKTIFVVDDSLTNLSMAEEALEKHYRVITLLSVEKMHEALKNLTPDLILLDIAMPGMSGFDAMKHLKSDRKYSDIPVIFLTALTDSHNEALGIELGAVDFITKPFSETVLLNRIRNHIQIDEIIRKRTEQLVRLKNGIVFTMADIVERRDKNTGGHVDRTSSYTRILLESMKKFGVYVDEIINWDPDLFITSAQLHDVGKINISDVILNKTGPLTESEFELVKTHTTEGENIIEQTITRTGEADFLQSAKLMAAHHHERWDGAGYPNGLKGEDIPLHGRIMAIVDVYDALVSERTYKKAYTHETAVTIIKNEAGKHFDPLITGVFCEINSQFAEIR